VIIELPPQERTRIRQMLVDLASLERPPGGVEVLPREPSRVLLPKDYPAAATLPPPFHPVGEPLPADRRFVTVVLDEPLPSEAAGARVDGQETEVREAFSARATWGMPGSATRLFSALPARSIDAVVRACTVDPNDHRLPSCFAGPAQHELDQTWSVLSTSESGGKEQCDRHYMMQLLSSLQP
jgi:hypothetical protein